TSGRRISPAVVEQSPIVAQNVLDALGLLALVAVIDLDAVKIDAAPNVRTWRPRVEADVGEITDALGQPRMVQLEIAIRVACSYRAEDGPHGGVLERRNHLLRRIGEDTEVAESFVVCRNLYPGDAEQLAVQIEHLERRRVVADDVVLG